MKYPALALLRRFVARLGQGKRVRIGVLVTRVQTTVVAVRGNALLGEDVGPGWEVAGGHGLALAGALTAIGTRIRGRRRSEVVIALGEEVVQVKRLFGLPPIADEIVGATIVRESASRFFRRTAHDLLTSGLEREEGGTFRAAAYRAEVVQELLRAVPRSAHEVHAIVPMSELDAAAGATSDDRDRMRGLALTAARLVDSPCLRLAAPFIGDAGDGAARLVSPRRAVIASAAMVVAAVALLLGPVVAPRLQRRGAEAERAKVAAAEVSGTGVAEELRLITATLADLATRTSERQSRVALLASMAEALPSASALLHLNLDSAGTTLVAVTANTRKLVEGLAGIPGVTGVEVIGPIVREQVGSLTLERVNVRFRNQAAAVGAMQ